MRLVSSVVPVPLTVVAALAVMAFALAVPPPAGANSTQILIAHGLVTPAQGAGADLFFRGTFSGNGRTCGTCHPPDNNQTIEPEFITTLDPDDPLFVAELPVSQGGVPGLERPLLMRGFGLILENVDGFQDPTVKFVMRGVPHSLSLATSLVPQPGFPHPEATGWGGDGSPDGTLRGFSSGAVNQHFTKTLARNAGTDFVLPTPTELQQMEAFMLSVGRLNELDLANVVMADTAADRGRRIFRNNGSNTTIAAGKCDNCHGNAGANVNFAGMENRNFDTGVEEVPHPARQVESFPFDGGLGTQLNKEGTFGDGTFNTTPLVEAADTGPFFHNHVIEDLEGAVEFYSGPFFNQSPAAALVGPINLTQTESAEVAAFLRVVNAAFNIAISIQRTGAGISLENSSSSCFGGGGAESSSAVGGGVGGGVEETCSGTEDPFAANGKKETINTLLLLANAEAADAVEVLRERGLHPSAVTLLLTGIDKNNQAIEANSSNVRKNLMLEANLAFSQAKSQLGTGLVFTLGQGNLLF
jgi:cytochrome c553